MLSLILTKFFDPLNIKPKSKKNKTSAFVLPSFASYVVDSTGTGDALLSYSTLSMIATKSLVVSSIIGSLAAACECEVDGNLPIKTKNVLSKIDNIEKMASYDSKPIS